MKKENLLSKGPHTIEPNESVAERVLAVVDQGLVRGMGKPKPGKMCVEAAVCFAMGQSHNDAPRCVNAEVRDFKIRLNDRSGWSSTISRGHGMRALAIAQLGSNKLGRGDFKLSLGQVMTALLSSLLAAEYSQSNPDKRIVRKLERELENWRNIPMWVNYFDRIVKAFSSRKIVARAGFSGKSAKNRLIAKIGLDALIRAKAEGTKFLKLLLKKRRK